MTLMSTLVGEDISVKTPADTDQDIHVESGCGIALTDCSFFVLDHRQKINHYSFVIIPAEIWHYLVNTGNRPPNLYLIYAPPHHPFDTVHRTKADAT